MTTLVIGGTGEMGARVVARLLVTSPATVRVLTRTPESVRARRVAALDAGRVELVAGSLDDADRVRAAMRGVDRVFCNTDFFASRSVPGEIEQGRTALLAARDSGVERFVYSSLDSAGALTGGRVPVPHFDAKAAVAAWITARRSDEMMRRERDGWFTEHVSVLTTAPYFENLVDRMPPTRAPLPDGREGLLFRLPLGPARYPMIALDDIAWFADHMLQHWQSWGARDLAVVGDAATGHEIAALVEQVSGTPSVYVDLPLAELARAIPDVGHDYAALGAFFQAHDIFAQNRDIAMLRRLHPGLRTLAEWLPSAASAW